MLADVMSKGKTGMEVQELLDMANITANKNTIPFDKQSVKLTSGMRFGTPAVTTRGMKEEEMKQIAGMITRLVDEGEAAVPQVKEQAIELCRAFPLYPEM
jgi:glycine hydroxymethyltransferase